MQTIGAFIFPLPLSLDTISVEKGCVVIITSGLYSFINGISFLLIRLFTLVIAFMIFSLFAVLYITLYMLGLFFAKYSYPSVMVLFKIGFMYSIVSSTITSLAKSDK